MYVSTRPFAEGMCSLTMIPSLKLTQLQESSDSARFQEQAIGHGHNESSGVTPGPG
jgi:hypothetical protein